MHHLCLDIDSTIPNLALMKVAGWAKARGDSVSLNYSQTYPDEVWISAIFTWNKARAYQAGSFWESSCQVHYGGTAFDWGAPLTERLRLPAEIEGTAPDYRFYADDRAVGFCQRGCNRKCQFCDVWRKEGRIDENAFVPLREWMPSGFRKCYLLDNDMALLPDELHDAILQDSLDLGLKLCISQGYDIRCLTPRRAQLLAQVRPWNVRFNAHRLYIAWDYPIEPAVRKGIQMLFDAGFRASEIMCYMIVGIGEAFSDDWHRYQVLANELGVLPYVMLFQNDRRDRLRNHFRRWVNRRYYHFVPWPAYCQKYALDPMGSGP